MNHIHAPAVRAARASALALVLGLGCVVSGIAQTTRDNSTSTGSQSTTMTPGTPGALGTTSDRAGMTPGTSRSDSSNTTYRNGDHDWGWMGLLGLIGLAGLRNKSNVNDVNRETNRSTSTTR